MCQIHLRPLLLYVSCFYLLEAAHSAIPRYAKTAELLQSPLQKRNLRLFRPVLDNWNTEIRHKRAADNFDDYDENADIRPNLEFPTDEKRLEERLQEQAAQIAESFKKMWESFGETMRHMAEGFQQMFGDGNSAYATDTPPRNEKNYESQWLK